MDIRITPISNFSSLNKSHKKDNQSSYFTNQLKPKTNKKLLLLAKSSHHNITNFNQSKLSLKFSTKINPLHSTEDKKGILLYQQIEREKPISNGTELTNRFHFKV